MSLTPPTSRQTLSQLMSKSPNLSCSGYVLFINHLIYYKLVVCSNLINVIFGVTALKSFLYARLKNGDGGKREQCLVSKLNKYYPILFKLEDNVFGHNDNVSAKFENGYCRPGCSRVNDPWITVISKF